MVIKGSDARFNKQSANQQKGRITRRRSKIEIQKEVDGVNRMQAGLKTAVNAAYERMAVAGGATFSGPSTNVYTSAVGTLRGAEDEIDRLNRQSTEAASSIVYMPRITYEGTETQPLTLTDVPF